MIEGDRATREARRARADFTLQAHRDIAAASHDAALALDDLRENAPDRYERALASWASGRADLIPALIEHQRQRRYAAEPKTRLRDLMRGWDPASEFTGDLSTTAGAFDMCMDVSARYTRYLQDLDEPHLRAEWIQVVGMRRECPTADPRWRSIPQEQWQHYATRVTLIDSKDPEARPEVQIVDYTLRQFDPQAAVPLIGSEKLYAVFFAETRAVSDEGLAAALKNPVHPNRIRKAGR